MALNKGKIFWNRVVCRLNGKTMTDEDYDYCDNLESKLTTKSDRRIMAYLDTLIENDEQKESYFKDDMRAYVNGAYKGYSDEKIMRNFINNITK